MMKGNRKTPLSGHTFDSVLGEGMVIDGRLKVSGSALIHGRVTGSIEADSDSTVVIIGIGETGRIDGNVIAHQVMVAGFIHGDVVGSSRVELMSTGTIEGNLSYGSLVVDEGAKVMGNMIHLGP